MRRCSHSKLQHIKFSEQSIKRNDHEVYSNDEILGKFELNNVYLKNHKEYKFGTVAKSSAHFSHLTSIVFRLIA